MWKISLYFNDQTRNSVRLGRVITRQVLFCLNSDSVCNLLGIKFHNGYYSCRGTKLSYKKEDRRLVNRRKERLTKQCSRKGKMVKSTRVKQNNELRDGSNIEIGDHTGHKLFFILKSQLLPTIVNQLSLVLMVAIAYI